MTDNNMTVVISTPKIETEIKVNAPIQAQVISGARGKSAYESWLDQGYTGSEADFIAALLTDITFEFEQDIPSEVWTINHNLNKYPAVTVVDSGGNVVVGDIVYLSRNSLTITFAAGFGGKAYLN